MSTFAAVVNAFLNTYTDCDATTAAQLLNDIDEEILAVIPYRKSSVYVGFTNGIPQYDADETVVKVWDAALLNPDLTRIPLVQTSESELDFKDSTWRGWTPSIPHSFGFSASLTTGRYLLAPAPNYTTLLVSGITNATPPVATTTTSHGLTNAQRITLQNATGTTLTGSYYAKVLSPTTVSFYSDAALSLPISAAGVGTAGIIGTQAQPILVLDCTQRLSLTSSSNMPLGPQLRRLYSDGMRWLWALQKHLDTAGPYGQQFQADLAIATDMWMRRDGNVPISIKSFRQNMSFRRSRSGWSRRDGNNWGPNN